MRNYSFTKSSRGNTAFLTFRRKLFFGFCVILLVLGLIFYISSVNSKTIVSTGKLVDHTHEVIIEGERVNYYYKDFVAQSRGYVITGLEIFNSAFSADTSEIKIHLKKLKNLTADNPSQLARVLRLDSALSQRIMFSRSLIVSKQQKGFEESKRLIESKKGIKISSRVELLISLVEAEEQILLTGRKRAIETSMNNSAVIAGLLQIILVLVILIVLYIVITSFKMRVKAVKELSENEAWFSKTLSGIGDGIIATTIEGKINFLNPVAEELTGWSQKEAEGKFITEVFHIINEVSRQKVVNPVETVLKTREIVKLENHTLLIKKDKTEVPIDDSAAPIFNKENEFIGVVLVFRNVEEERNAAKILEQKVADRTAEIIKTEKRYHDTLENMLEGVQIIDRNWKYVYVNNSLARQGKYPAKELIGYTMMEKYPGIENTELFKCLRKCMEGRKSFIFENEFAFPDGSMGYFELSMQPVPEGIFILSIDISARKKAENDLKKLNEDLEKKVAERTEQLRSVNNELESFSYSVSHDLRAPLRAISGYTTILTEDYSDKIDEEGQRLMKIIQDNVKQMGQLITDLLAFAQMGKDNLKKSEVDMNALVKQIAEEQKSAYKGKNISLTINDLGKIEADESMLKHVVTNLLSNALKYSSKKENIQIEVGRYQEKNEGVFYVKDEGAGFNMEYYNRLFGVFQRLHNMKDYEGTGVGLALVKRIITRHNGKVWAEGEEGKGATFYFSLPS
ncbi:MAG: ATP-binding protein [Bacteroidia bacterium]